MSVTETLLQVLVNLVLIVAIGGVIIGAVAAIGWLLELFLGTVSDERLDRYLDGPPPEYRIDPKTIKDAISKIDELNKRESGGWKK